MVQQTILNGTNTSELLDAMRFMKEFRNDS